MSNWWTQWPWRMVQTNLREIDWRDIDADRFVGDLKDFKANIVLLGRMFTTQSFWSLDTLVATIVVGANTGYSAIVVAHELIHRRSWWEQQLGRLLMCTAMYEHFYTEHLRGHHVRVGTVADPATARYGESFARFRASFLRGLLDESPGEHERNVLGNERVADPAVDDGTRQNSEKSGRHRRFGIRAL